MNNSLFLIWDTVACFLEKALALCSSTLAWKIHGWRSLVGCGPWGRQESETTERLHFHFSLSCIGEGNGNPLQCSCLDNPRDGGAWWAAVCGVTQSRTRLKWLSSSSSMLFRCHPMRRCLSPSLLKLLLECLPWPNFHLLSYLVILVLKWIYLYMLGWLKISLRFF